MRRAGVLLLLCGVVCATPLAADNESTDTAGPVIPAAPSTDICGQGPMKGGAFIECDAYFPKYTFNMERGSCEGYIYGGCGGSANLFDTRAECEQKCGHHARVSREVSAAGDECGEAPESGRCLALIPRYAYNQESGTCHEFMFGGCGGNANRFKTEAECLARCRPGTQGVSPEQDLPAVEQN